MPRSNRRHSAALSVKKKQDGGGCFLVAFFTIFFVAGSVMLFLMLIRPLYLVSTSGDWVETPCTIMSSKVGVHDGDDSTTYSIDIEYTYTVDGVAHTADRYSFMGGFSSSGRAGKKVVVRQYPKGAVRKCFVDPDDPESAVLNRDLTGSMWWGLFPIPFFLIGACGLAWLTWKKLRGPSEPASKSEAVSHSAIATQAMNAPSRDGSVGAVTLKQKMSPGFKFLGILAVAVFWNGIVSVFGVQLIDDFEWFLAIFLIPFVVIGVGMIGGVLYTGLAMFNARPTLTLNPASIPLGGSAELTWRFSRTFTRIQRLTIRLYAEEKATYRRGTDTTTDTEAFFDDVLVDAQGMMMEVAEGSTTVEIPTDRMHSFKSDNNEIVWMIKLEGDIPFWPDIKAEFPITVRPHDA